MHQFIKQNMHNITTMALITVSACFLIPLASCSNSRDNPVIIWTDRAELASYAELFNATHDTKVVVIYKKDTARSLPPAKDEQTPDLIISSYLKTSNTKKNFISVNRFFEQRRLSKDAFYSKLLEYGSINRRQYLIPVSFNLPAMLVRTSDTVYIPDTHIITLSDIKKAGAAFSSKNNKGIFETMGYAPAWDKNFLYLVAKYKNADFKENDLTFTYNAEGIASTVTYIKDWTSSCNTNTNEELSFLFNYLYMPKNKQLDSGKSLFVYMNSDDVFPVLNKDQSKKLTFRWISDGENLLVEDDIICMGVYKKAPNINRAEAFISWFFKEDTQRELLKRTESMNLDTIKFGICGGLSSLKSVNNKVFPTFYNDLLGNLPTENMLRLPENLPDRWEIFKSRIIIPFLEENTVVQADEQDSQQSDKPRKTLDEYIADWSRQAF